MKPFFKHISMMSALLSAQLMSATAMAEDVTTIELDETIISADFRPAKASETAVSLTEIDEETIEARGAQHLEEVLNLAPNVNLSAGASRGQFFQIRGMGIRSQFEAPINPDVGLIIDGIDFSRTGSAGTLFDIESIEILRGPQGTRFGTNALAGTINLRSKAPTENFNLHMETGFAEYNTRNFGVAVGGALIENRVLGRASIYSHKSDGYMDNDFLNRDNTNNQDELTLRGKLKFLVSDNFTVDLSYIHLDINNGYDAFTLDNSRNSQSNQPGEDKNRSNAIAVKTGWQAPNGITLQTETSFLKSDILYGFDYDWTGNASFTALYERERENASFDIRALSDKTNRVFGETTDWTIGLFYLDQDEAIDVRDDFADTFTGDYDTKNYAVYGQLDTHFSDKFTVITGLRLERFSADYSDSRSIDIDTGETMAGGKFGFTYQVDPDNLFFSTLSRGYKSGGVNNTNSAQLTDDEREFDTEYNYSLETGIKSFWLNRRMMTDLTVFYTKRRDAQIRNSTQITTGGFENLTSNATNAIHKGVEASMDWLVNDKVRVLASLGVLDAKFDNYNTSSVALGNRQVAHAPNYTFSLGTELYPSSHWTIRANVEGKDDFYFSDSNNAKSDSYAIFNASADYSFDHWRVRIWARNLFDRDYYNRGFFFDNTPPDFTNNPQKYVQFAEPRVAGVTVSYDY